MVNMHMNKITIAILGSGSMGSQIALEFARYGHTVYLYDMSFANAQQGLLKSVENISTKEILNNIPSIDFYTSAAQKHIECYDYSAENLNKLNKCSLVIEAIVENIEIKQKLYANIKPYLNNNAILASNTSGLNIEQLAQYAHNPELFCGLHFFNPPRHLSLIEYIIPNNYNNNNNINKIIQILSHKMHFNVIPAKNIPNFIANRIGFFAWLVVAHSAAKLNIPISIADEMSGTNIGRSKSATFRTADIVGLDIVKAVILNMQDLGYVDEKYKQWFAVPQALEYLIKHGSLGQKSLYGKGFYQKKDGVIYQWDGDIHKQTPEYIPLLSSLDKYNISDIDIAYFKDVINNQLHSYINDNHEAIAYNKTDVYKAMHYGFGWDMPS
jgi:3-hydroxyacyl-CoA dehydrogenase